MALPKILILVLLAFAAWYAARWLSRPPRNLAPRRRAAAPQGRPAIEAEDLVACARCGAYVAASARHCGRPDCPRPRA